MPCDVFISHSSQDKLVADAVCAALESNRIRCWIAPRDVPPGIEWAEAIITAIADCRVLVVICSDGANASRQIVREVERAVNKGLIIVPLRVQDVPFSKPLEYFLSTCHWLDAITPPIEHHIQHLVDTIGFLLSRDSTHRDHNTPPGAPRDLEATIRAKDPNDISFKEVTVKLSDTWDGLRAWLATELGDATIQSICEDDESEEASFFCSGRPGNLSYRLAVTAKRRGVSVVHKFDVIQEWLHPLAVSMEATKTYMAWDSSLFPPNGEREKRIDIQDPIAKCRDCDYWVLFAKPR